jgi:hypothetical protein
LNPQFSFAVIGIDRNIYGAYIGLKGISFKQNPATPILSFTADDNMKLLWYPSKVSGGSILGVQINFVFRQPVSVNSNGTNPIYSFLISLPTLFENAIKLPSDFINNNTHLAITSVDYNHTNYLVVYTDRRQKIDAGQYGFRFPVRVPYQVASDNVWYLSLCGDQGECTGIDSAGIITTIPIAGFAIGDDNPYTRIEQVKGGGMTANIRWLLALLFTAHFW